MLVDKVKLKASVRFGAAAAGYSVLYRIITRERHSSASDHQTESKF